MTLHKIGTQGLISIAFIIPAALVLSFCEAKAMDDLTMAGVYSVDRVLCGLHVDQDWINRALANAVITKDISPSEALYSAALIGTSLQGNIQESGRVQEYCKARTARAY